MLYPNDARYYQGVIGGKTGYTSLAGNTLVTCAERDGVRLIAVIMKSKSTQYTDTSALLDYGFALKSGGSQTAKWQQEGAKWYFVKNDGNRAANEWMTIDGADYWFDSDGTMATAGAIIPTTRGIISSPAALWLPVPGWSPTANGFTWAPMGR